MKATFGTILLRRMPTRQDLSHIQRRGAKEIRGRGGGLRDNKTTNPECFYADSSGREY